MSDRTKSTGLEEQASTAVASQAHGFRKVSPPDTETPSGLGQAHGSRKVSPPDTETLAGLDRWFSCTSMSTRGQPSSMVTTNAGLS